MAISGRDLRQVVRFLQRAGEAPARRRMATRSAARYSRSLERSSRPSCSTSRSSSSIGSGSLTRPATTWRRTRPASSTRSRRTATRTPSGHSAEHREPARSDSPRSSRSWDLHRLDFYQSFLHADVGALRAGLLRRRGSNLGAELGLDDDARHRRLRPGRARPFASVHMKPRERASMAVPCTGCNARATSRGFSGLGGGYVLERQTPRRSPNAWGHETRQEG